VTYRLIAMLAAAALLAFLVIFGPSMCNSYFAQKEARKIEGGQADAMLDSIDTALVTEAERNALADSIEAENKALADSIRAEEPGDSNDATMAAVCKTQTYRDHPDCKENTDVP